MCPVSERPAGTSSHQTVGAGPISGRSWLASIGPILGRHHTLPGHIYWMSLWFSLQKGWDWGIILGFFMVSIIHDCTLGWSFSHTGHYTTVDVCLREANWDLRSGYKVDECDNGTRQYLTSRISASSPFCGNCVKGICSDATQKAGSRRRVHEVPGWTITITAIDWLIDWLID